MPPISMLDRTKSSGTAMPEGAACAMAGCPTGLAGSREDAVMPASGSNLRRLDVRRRD